MKIEMRLGEGDRGILLDGKPLLGVVKALVTLTPEAAFVHLTIAPEYLWIEGEADIRVTADEVGR